MTHGVWCGVEQGGGGVSCKWGSECTGRRAWGVTCPSEGGVWTGPPVGDFPLSSQSRGWGSTLPTRGEGIHIVNFYHWHSFYFGGSSLVTFCAAPYQTKNRYYHCHLKCEMYDKKMKVSYYVTMTGAQIFNSLKSESDGQIFNKKNDGQTW